MKVVLHSVFHQVFLALLKDIYVNALTEMLPALTSLQQFRQSPGSVLLEMPFRETDYCENKVLLYYSLFSMSYFKKNIF